MPLTDIGSAVASDLTNVVKDFEVSTATTDGVGEQEETEFTIEFWSKWFGYYKSIPELATAIDAIATWTVGKGFKADPVTEMLLNTFTGWGKDTFNTILENMIRTYYIAGDAFAEIIRDEEGNLINLKPLDPSSIMIVANRQGLVKRYEKISKTKTPNKKMRVDQIFHLARNRVADEIHGVSIVEKLEVIILMRNEAMDDMKQLMHRHVKPMRIWHLDTDDKEKIKAFKATIDKATEDGENTYIPKGTVEHELVTVPANATLNPLTWIDNLNNYFFQATGGTDIVIGATKDITEASAKIRYLAFQQNVEEEQLFIEEQTLQQLNLEINLEFPASLENELLSDKAKDGPVNIDQSETTA